MTARPRLLVIGGGSIGERHVRCFQKTGRVDVMLCEVESALRQRLVAEHGLQDSFGDFESALAASPDLAVICTPAHLHVSLAQALVDRRIPVQIEKPLSTDWNGVERLLKTAEERNVPASVAYVYRANPVLQQMRDALHSGRFGRPVQLVMTSGQNFPYYRPAYRNIYYRDRSTGGGAVQDALTHCINAGEWLIGPITELTADIAHQLLEGVEVEDTAHVLARHGMVLATYSLNQYQAPNETRFTVVCERGTVRIDVHRQIWKWTVDPEAPWHEEPPVRLARDDLFVLQANRFLDSVDNNADPLCSLREAVQTLRVNMAILASAETRTWQSIST